MDGWAVVTGLLAGGGLGYVLQRGRLCFHSAVAQALERRALLAQSWLVGVTVGAVGLAVLFLLPGTGGLNEGLAFRPLANVAGGLLIGVGMVVAQSCVSGLFYKLGSGMLGALVGLAGWSMGELVAAEVVDRPGGLGPTILSGGEGATLAGLLGLPRLLVAVVLLVLVLVLVRRAPARGRTPAPRQWTGTRLGVGLGVALVASWALAAAGGHGFGASTVGATRSVAVGRPDWWLVAFLAGMVLGAAVAARTAGGWWVRGESPVRYAQLAAGGLLLGAGGWVAGGCNLGHGLSGVAQLNLSSAVVVAAIVAGVALARAVLAPRLREPVPSIPPGE